MTIHGNSDKEIKDAAKGVPVIIVGISGRRVGFTSEGEALVREMARASAVEHAANAERLTAEDEAILERVNRDLREVFPGWK